MKHFELPTVAEEPHRRRREAHGDDARSLVLALTGIALGASISTAALVLGRLVAEPGRAETIGVMLLVGLLLGGCWIIWFIVDISRPQRGRWYHPAGQRTTRGLRLRLRPRSNDRGHDAASAHYENPGDFVASRKC